MCLAMSQLPVDTLYSVSRYFALLGNLALWLY